MFTDIVWIGLALGTISSAINFIIVLVSIIQDKKVAWAEGYICVLMLSFTGSHGFLWHARTMMHMDVGKFYYQVSRTDYFPLVSFIAMANITFIVYKIINIYGKRNGKT